MKEGGEPMKKPLRPDVKRIVKRFVRPENYEEWLATPNALLNNRTPQELIDSGDEDMIRAAVELALEKEVSS